MIRTLSGYYETFGRKEIRKALRKFYPSICLEVISKTPREIKVYSFFGEGFDGLQNNARILISRGVQSEDYVFISFKNSSIHDVLSGSHYVDSNDRITKL
jgi:hypothetical protein